MPRQQIVFAANTMDFWRTSINTLVGNVNFGTANSFITDGNIFLSGTGTALNVSNGTLRGNGILLFSLNALAMFGTVRNNLLQNTSLNVITSAGVTGGSLGIPLGGTITLTADVVDSITNTRIDLPASANSVVWAMIKANTDALNASIVTNVVDETRGGLGETTYTAGDILVGNSASGKLDKTRFTAGAGIVTTVANGSVTISANLIQGSGVILSSSGNSGITISANGYQLGNLTQSGLIVLYDEANSTATGLAVTANAVNAVSNRIRDTSGRANLVGRLIDKKVYTTANLAGIPGIIEGTFHNWTKPANTNWVKVIVVGGGGAGANCGNTATVADSFVSTGGGAGAIYTWVNTAITIPSTVSVFAGGGGWASANSEANRSGSESYFGDNYVEAAGGYGGKMSQYTELSNSVQQVTCIATKASGGPTVSEKFWDVVLNSYSDPGFIQWHQTAPNHTLTDVPCYAFGGVGGSTPYGQGGMGGVIGGMTDNTKYCHGKDGIGYGAGGGGAVADWNCDPIGIEPETRGWVRGGNGAPGLVIVESYSDS